MTIQTAVVGIVSIAHIPDRTRQHFPIRHMLSPCAFNAKRSLLLYGSTWVCNFTREMKFNSHRPVLSVRNEIYYCTTPYMQLSTRSEVQPTLPCAFSAKRGLLLYNFISDWVCVRSGLCPIGSVSDREMSSYPIKNVRNRDSLLLCICAW